MTKKPENKKTDPMDPSIREQVIGTPATNNKRVCYAIKTLAAEVGELFPETPVEYSEYDGRNTALGVTFDLTVLEPEEADQFCSLLKLPTSDVRVEEVLAEDGLVLVVMRSSARTQDDRSSFHLADAWMAMSDENDPGMYPGEFGKDVGSW